jgi:hypothetical protein
MYINIDEKKLKKEWARLKKETIEQEGEDTGTLLISNTEDIIEDISYLRGILTVDFSNEYGYFSFEIEVDDDLFEKILTERKERARRLKNLLKLLGEED